MLAIIEPSKSDFGAVVLSPLLSFRTLVDVGAGDCGLCCVDESGIMLLLFNDWASWSMGGGGGGGGCGISSFGSGGKILNGGCTGGAGCIGCCSETHGVWSSVATSGVGGAGVVGGDGDEGVRGIEGAEVFECDDETWTGDATSLVSLLTSWLCGVVSLGTDCDGLGFDTSTFFDAISFDFFSDDEEWLDDDDNAFRFSSRRCLSECDFFADEWDRCESLLLPDLCLSLSFFSLWLDGDDDDDDDVCFLEVLMLFGSIELELFLCVLCSMINFLISILASSASLGLLCSLIIGDLSGSFLSFLILPSCVRFIGVCAFLPSWHSALIGFGRIVCFSL